MEKLTLHSRPPNMSGMRLAGAVFLALFALGALMLLLRGAETVTTPQVILTAIPLVVGLMLIYVGFTGDRMRRRLAVIDRSGAQVGVHAHLAWDQVARIERRGSGAFDTLILYPAHRHMIRRPIPVGRADGKAEDLVQDILSLAQAGGLALTEDGGNTAAQRTIWRVANGGVQDTGGRAQVSA